MAHILVAEDDPDILELVLYKLEQSDYQVTAVSDGVQALAKTRELEPDLLILDVMMPFLSGIDVLEKVRSDPSTKSIPVILLTAKSLELDSERGFAAGANDYITKPFSPRELISRVQAVLGR